MTLDQRIAEIAERIDRRATDAFGQIRLIELVTDAIREAIADPEIVAHIRRAAWFPIESAPKDRSDVLLGIFDNGNKRYGHCEVDWWHIPKIDGCTYTGWGKFNEKYWPPTHWQPLPEPPLPESENG